MIDTKPKHPIVGTKDNPFYVKLATGAEPGETEVPDWMLTVGAVALSVTVSYFLQRYLDKVTSK
jgi:hypothetical protein